MQKFQLSPLPENATKNTTKQAIHSEVYKANPLFILK